MTKSVACIWLAATLLVPAVPVAAPGQTSDTLRGRVTTDKGVVIVGAEVVATRAPDRTFKSALTDARGSYQIIFEQGTGDYLVHAAAIGRESARARVQRTGGETTLSHDFMLKSAVQQLKTVEVEGAAKPERDIVGFPSSQPGEAGQDVGGVVSAIPLDARGNIAAAAATIPGVAVTPNGISVLGLNPSQNRTTLNGMSFNGADIPRGVRSYTHVATSSYDPSLGWFGGAEVDVNVEEGNFFISRPVSLTIESPLLQFGDATSRALGEKFSNVIAALGSSGSLGSDRVAYKMGVDISRRTSDFASLDRAAPDLLERSGVAQDSVARFLGILSALGIPFSSSSLSDNRTSDNLTFLGRLDRPGYNFAKNENEKVTWGLLGYAKLGRSSLLGVGPTTVAMNGGENHEQIFSAQAVYSSFFRDKDYLTDARTSFSLKRDRTTPYQRIPGASVLVNSQFPDSLDATTFLAFGGNGLLAQDSRDWTWETKSITSFYASRRSAHRVQLTADSRIDGFLQTSASNSNGRFLFNSLADLEANTPISFTRTLGVPTAAVREWNAFAALGDYWRESQTFQVLAGVRLEANRFLDKPPYNQKVETTFGVRTDQAPAGVSASPRIGFTWIRKPGRPGFRTSQIGQFPSGSPSYIRGGIGEFRDFLSPSVFSPAMVATGLPGGAAYITCIGAATPIPDWRVYVTDPVTIPEQCASGTGATPFADAAPRVSLFYKSYQPPRSWRANLSYAASLSRFILFTVEGIYSLNLNQPGQRDLNFANVQRFSTSLEGRPVFAGASSILPSSGLVSSADSRRSSLFGSVISNRSDLRSISRQLNVNVSPSDAIGGAWYLSLAYTLKSVRELASGFDAPTFSSPVDREWSRADLDSRHQIQVQAGRSINRITLTLFGTFQSGLPFTPMVGGDVNGDGLFNDRAFIFNPPAATDSAVGAGLRSLVASSSGRTRNCLLRQLGRAAVRNSCEGPWAAMLNASVHTFVTIPHTDKHIASISLALLNPLGGLDQLLHGSSHLRGWGAQPFLDPVLYNVRGFDPMTNQFRYEVNPRFGNTPPAASIVRSPFRVTLSISTNIGPDFGLQQLQRAVSAGRTGHPGPRLSEADLKKRYARSVPDPYAAILEESDSLLLTADQSKAIDSVHAEYLHGMDSVLTPLAEYLAALGDTFDAKEALKHQEETIDAAWDFARLHVQKSLSSILSPIQVKLLPWPAGYLYNAKKPIRGVRAFIG
jgi:hypothetical protein